MAEALFHDAARAQLFERVASDGAAPLYERLVAAAGLPVAVPAGMEEMAAWLDGRGLLLRSEAGVMLPTDLALLEQRRAAVEEGWLFTLLGRCAEANLRSISETLGVTLRARRIDLVMAVGRAVLTAGESRKGERLAPTLVAELRSVEAVARDGKVHFLVETSAGRSEVVARTSVEPVAAAGRPKRKKVEPVSPFSFPRHGAASAVVVASSPSYARYLMTLPALSGYLGQQLDGCRFAAPAEVSFAELRATMADALPEGEVSHVR